MIDQAAHDERRVRVTSTAWRALGGRRGPGTARPRASRRADFLRGAVLVVLLLAAWQLWVDIAHPRKEVIVGPLAVASAFWADIGNGTLASALAVSLKQFVLGFGIAVLISVPLGLLIGMFRTVRSYAEPWLVILYTAPIIALAPVFVVMLGIGLRDHLIIIALVSCFPIILNTADGVQAVQRDLQEVGIAFRATPYETFWRIAMPGAASSIFTGIRVGMGRGLVGIVVADLFGATGGLGYLIISATNSLATAQIFVGVTVLALLGLLFSVAFRYIQRKLMPWDRSV